MNHESQTQGWITVESPGYLGSKKDEYLKYLDTTYGQGNWRIAWVLANAQIWDFESIFYNGYVDSYAAYFRQHSDGDTFLTKNYAFAYDKDIVTKDQAFDPFYLYDKPGRPNQFHNVALNIALVRILNLPFQGQLPIQVREGEPNTPESSWPEGWRWSPGRIPFSGEPTLIPSTAITGWWKPGSIEELYQTAKVIQIRAQITQSA